MFESPHPHQKKKRRWVHFRVYLAAVLAVERYFANIFSVTRQLRYSKDETQPALDLGRER